MTDIHNLKLKINGELKTLVTFRYFEKTYFYLSQKMVENAWWN